MIRPIGKHIDALYLTVKGELTDSMVEILRGFKAEAAERESNRVPLVELHDELVPGGPFFIQAKGTRGYEFVLRNQRFYIALSSQKHLPAMQVQPLAETLYEYDLDGLEGIVQRLREIFVPRGTDTLVSRCDVAVDFQGALDDWRLPDIEDVVTRARHRRLHFDRLQGQTMTLGNHGGAMQVQIYNKSAEAAKGEKGWLRQIWAECKHYEEEKTVWRAEVRFKREILSNFGISGIPELRAVLGDLLAYAVSPDEPGAWVRFSDAMSRDEQTNRRPAASWWSRLARYFLAGELSEGRRRLRPKGLDSISRGMDMTVAWASKIAALWRKGKLHDGHTDFGQALFGAMVAHLTRKGKTWAEVVNAKQDALKDEDLIGGRVFQLTPAMIRLDAELLRRQRRQREELQELQDSETSPAWETAWAEYQRIKRQNEIIDNVHRLERIHSDEELVPPELSGSTLQLLRVRPSIEHEAGFYVTNNQKGER